MRLLKDRATSPHKRQWNLAEIDMFKIVLVVLALTSGRKDIIEVSPEFASFAMCEEARPDLADDFRQYLERRHLQPFKVDSKCMKNDGV